MALTGAVYKWRLDNTSYAYITNETGGTPFIATNENNIDEGEIKEKVVSWDEQKYCEQFTDMVNMVHASSGYTNLQFLDCSIYLSEFSDCPDSVLKPLIPTDIALTVEATPDTVQAEFIDEGTIYSDGEYLKQFKLKLNIPTEECGVEYTAGENIDITTGNTISALGYRYDQDKDSIAVGSGSVALGMYSYAEGIGTQANGEASHAEGYQTESRGNFSHTEGRETLVQGTCGHAEGWDSKAIGTASHAEGEQTQANGEFSHAEGYGTQALGDFSHAEGETTIAYGDSSHTEGLGTITNNVGEHAEGKYNHSNSDIEDTNNIGLNTIHSIGIGTSDNDRKNAFEVMENGDIYVYNVGDYDGTNATENNTKTLQDVLGELNNGSGSSSGITYVGGNNIDITGNTITAKGYTYNNDNDTETLEFSDNILSLGGGDATIHYDADDDKNIMNITSNNNMDITADGEMSISNTSDINVSTSEGDIKIVGGYNVAITAKGHSMGIITEGDMIITANGETMDITNTVGGINISSNNDMNITANGETMNITATEGNIKITASKGDISVDSSSFSSTCPITAEVNGVENVYLGCPIGTIVMWAGQTAPDGWLLCNGDRIRIKNSKPIEQTLQGVSFQEGKLQSLVNVIGVGFGSYTIISINTSNDEYISDADINYDTNTITINALNGDINNAYKFYIDSSIPYTIKDTQGTRFDTDEYTKYYTLELPDLQQKFPLGAMNNGTIGSDTGGTPYNINLGDTGGEDMHTLTINEMPSHSHTITTTDGVNGSGSNHVDDANSQDSETYFSTNSNGGGQSHNNIPPFLAINFIIKYK